MSKEGKPRISLNVKKRKVIRAKELEDKVDKTVEMVNNSSEEKNKIRQSRIGKTSLELIKEMENYEQEENDSGLKIKNILITFLIVAVIVILYLFLKYAAIFGISLNPDKSKSFLIDVITSDDDIYESYNGELVVYSNQTLTTYNKDGERTWQYDLAQSFVPKLYIKDKYMVISNSANGYIYLFYNKKEILDKKIDGTIKSIYLDEYGNMAVEYSTNGYKKIIGVYNKNGDTLSEIYLNSDAIVDISLIDRCSKVLVTKVVSSSYSVGIQVVSYNLKDENLTESEIAKIDDAYAFKVVNKKSEIILLCEDKIISINYNTKEQKTIKEFKESQIIFSDIAKNYYVMVESLLQDTNNLYKISMNSYSGEEITSVELNNSPMSLKNDGYVNYLIYQNTVDVFNKWGVNIKKIDINMYPKKTVTFNDGKSIALIYTNKIEIFNI